MKLSAKKLFALALTLLLALSCLAGTALAALPPPTVEYTPIDGASSLPPPTVEYTPIEGPSAAAPVILEPLELWRVAGKGVNPTEELNLSFEFSQLVDSQAGTVTIDNGAKVEFIPRPEFNFGSTRFDCTITDWKPQATYNVTFSGFKNEAGVAMQPATKSVFVPFKTIKPPTPEINRIQPAGKVLAPKTKTLRFRFDKDVKYGGNAALLNDEQINLRMSGKRTAIVTLPALKPGTEYELSFELLYTEELAKGGANEDWLYVRYNFSTSGSAPAGQIPVIESVSSEVVGGVPNITFNFSEEMYTMGDITLNGEAITGWQWDTSGKGMILPLPGLKPNTKYELALDGAFITNANRIKMKPVKYTFETGASAGAKIELAAVSGE